MHGVLFLLIGLGLACNFGMLLSGAPATPLPSSVADAPTIAAPAERWLLVIGCRLTVLLPRPARSIGVLSALALVLGCITIVIGAANAYWDHAMRPNETVSDWIFVGGVLMLLSQAVVWLRFLAGSRGR